MKNIFTSESVTEGHPDKMCDQIADAVLDAILKEDRDARVACEIATSVGLVLVMGEVTTQCYVDIPTIVRETVREIGYIRAKYGFDCDTCSVLTSIKEQSNDIRMGVDHAFDDDRDTGAGDQGMMFGYASRETEELMPLPILSAHKLARRLAFVRKQGILRYLRPDGKTQVSVEYSRGKPVRFSSVVVSAQHHEEVSMEELRRDIREQVIWKVLDGDMLDRNTEILINPTGRFVMGGPLADCGLTGRKIIVDTYGGMGRHGGGAFSGKDPTKVDRSGAYAARKVAKTIVAAGLCDECEVQIAYAIGVAHPVSIGVDTFGTNRVDEGKIRKAVTELFDLRPSAIIRDLNLRQPIYKQLAAYGHFGRSDLDVPWEHIDMAEELKKRF